MLRRIPSSHAAGVWLTIFNTEMQNWSDETAELVGSKGSVFQPLARRKLVLIAVS